ncbi:hypothetical protein [Sphingomonas sp. PB4P5]|uniref:hypothetical protein n=1 Tax=Parasphingomonas puruogangriensis TaxID=3096155 RepID=UPI002FC87D3D
MDAEARNRIAVDYVGAFQRDGSRALIDNLDTHVTLHRWGDHLLPLTVNDGARGGTFVCSPRVGYRDYPLEELGHFPNRALIPPLRLLIRSIGALLDRCQVDRVVHVNNWMMSTNLPVALDPALASAQTDALTDAWPTHLLAIRSLTRRHSAPLIDALEAAGWILLPSRQVFIVDDVAQACLPRRDTKRDDRLWAAGTFAYQELTEVAGEDAARIAALYALLYREKYSQLNPAFTPAFVMLTARIGLLRYLVLRDRGGVIQGFGAMFHAGSDATMPLLGYDTHADQALGLYRLSFHAGTRYAARHGLRFNMSSGATAFKRHRGATPEMEFTAFYPHHLPAGRRRPFGLLQALANRIAMPMLRKYQL